MKFISKISKQGEDYFIRIPRDKRDKLTPDLMDESIRIILEALD